MALKFNDSLAEHIIKTKNPKIWINAIENGYISKEFLEYLNENEDKFSDFIIAEITEGLKLNFDEAKIRTYAKFELPEHVVNNMVISYREGLSIEQVEFCCNPKYKSDKIIGLRRALIERFTMKELEYVTIGDYDDVQISYICRIMKYYPERLKMCLNNKLVQEQFEIILKGINAGFKDDQLKFFVTNDYDELEFEMIFNLFLFGLTVEQAVKCLEWGTFNKYECEQIAKGFEHGLTVEQIEFYSKSYFGALSMEQIRLCYENGMLTSDMFIYGRDHRDIKKAREEFELKKDGEKLKKLLSTMFNN